MFCANLGVSKREKISLWLWVAIDSRNLYFTCPYRWGRRRNNLCQLLCGLHDWGSTEADANYKPLNDRGYYRCGYAKVLWIGLLQLCKYSVSKKLEKEYKPFETTFQKHKRLLCSSLISILSRRTQPNLRTILRELRLKRSAFCVL